VWPRCDEMACVKRTGNAHVHACTQQVEAVRVLVHATE
jgi:hypothetical protein